MRWRMTSAREPLLSSCGVVVDLSPHSSSGAHAEWKPRRRSSCETGMEMVVANLLYAAQLGCSRPWFPTFLRLH